jgi:hypothetical protein
LQVYEINERALQKYKNSNSWNCLRFW